MSRLTRMPRNGPSDPADRVAEFGDQGFVEFRVDEQAALVRIYAVAWTG